MIVLGVFMTLLGDGPPPGSRVLFDFRQPGATNGWSAIDDRVMGGLSSSRLMETDQSRARFTGRVSLANNGGFASVRSAPNKFDAREYAGIWLRVRGDGKKYLLNLRDEPTFDGVSHRAALAVPEGEWTNLFFSFEELEPVFRGNRVTNAKRLNLSAIETVGLMISSKQVGDFILDVAWIAFGPAPDTSPRPDS